MNRLKSLSWATIFDALQDFTEEWVIQAADNDTQYLGPVGFQRTGGCTGLVAHLLGNLPDAFAGFI